MYLVPEEVMTLIRQQNDIQTSPVVKSMSSLSQQMSNTLSDQNQPAEIKIKNHDQLLQRYLNLQEQRENYIPTVKLHAEAIPLPQVTQPLSQEPQPQGQLQPVSESEILDTVPKTFRSQAGNLLRWIKKTPEAVQWDEKGEVSLEGQTLKGSSISDLINDSLRKRRGFQPPGRDAFTEVLAKLNTPEDFIRNDDRRRLMGLFKVGGRLPPTTPIVTSEERNLMPTPPTTPRKQTPSPLTRKRGLRPSTLGRKNLGWLPY